MDAIGEVLAEMSSPNWSLVHHGAEQAGNLLKAGAGSKDEASQLAAKLTQLSRHPKWEVRKAVAHAVEHVSDHAIHPVIASLLKDDNEWVQQAARRAVARRTELTHTDVLRDQRAEKLLGWLTDLERKYGTRVRTAALRVAERYTGMMVKEAHHEMAKVISPLDASLMNLEAARRSGPIDPRMLDDQLACMRERLDLLDEMITSFMKFTEDVVPEFRSENLCAMVQTAVELMHDRVPNGGRPLMARVVIPGALQVEAHKPRLLQVFGNLIQNAYESYDGTRRRRRLEIRGRLDPSGTRVVLAFRDWGCGMTAEAARNCIRLYTTSKETGTGFGLPLAKKIVEAEHRGSLSLSSEKGVGTTITISFPVDQEPRGTP